MNNYKKIVIDIKTLIVLYLVVLIAGCASTSEEDSAPVSETPQPRSEVITATPPPPSPPASNVEEVVVTSTRSTKSPREQREQQRDAERYQRQQAVAQLNHRIQQMESEYNKTVIIEEPLFQQRVDPSMIFKNYGVNPTINTLDETTTTFSIDVDTASYNIAKGFLDNLVMPDADGIRVEEFVNSFDYGYQAPREEAFSLYAEAFPSPFRKGFHILHLGIKGQDFSSVEEKNTNLTLLVDVSGSMGGGNRLETLKQGLYQLVDSMSPRDNITIVVYSTEARLHLEATEVRNKRTINNAIATLAPENSTNIEAGIELAYRMANKSYDPERNNRIVLCSDGVANIGQTNAEKMMKNVSAAAKKGIYLNSVGIGMGNYNDVTLEELAKQGQGHYAYINSPTDANMIFAKALLRNMQVLARDVRVQVEFDPLFIESYRLLGYENHGMDNKDFHNAKKDAGEVGVGHSVTAVYEIKFRTVTTGDLLSVRDNLGSNDFGIFRVNYKNTDSDQLHLIERSLPSSIVRNKLQKTTENAQLSYIAAAFAEKLRGSYWSRTYSYNDLREWLQPITFKISARSGAMELAKYLRLAEQYDHRGDLYTHVGPVKNMDFDHVPVLGNQY